MPQSYARSSPNSDSCRLNEDGYDGILCNPPRSRVTMDATTARLAQETCSWEMLSLKIAVGHLGQISERPSLHDYLCILQKCRSEKNLVYTKRVHIHIHADGLEAHEMIGNHLVPVFVECGSIVDAQQVFNRLIHRNEYCWTSLIQGYTEGGEYTRVLELFQDMGEDHIHPTRYTLEALLKACASLQCIDKSLELHVEIAKEGFEKDFFIGSSLVDLYVKCGLLGEARNAFDELEDHDVVVWNFLIAGYTKHGYGVEPLNCLDQMRLKGVSLDAVTYVCALKACSIIGAVDRGQTMHAEIVKQGFESSSFVGNTLIDMYAKCGALEEAWEVFEAMPVQDVVTWSALVAGYAEHGLGEEALNCLQRMQLKGVPPNAVTFFSGLKACTSIEAVNRGLEIHVQIAIEEYERELFVRSNLLDFYAKCGLFAEAWEVFDEGGVRDVVSWNALVSGYAKHGFGEEVLDCVDQLQMEGIRPDAVTFVCGLKACGSIRALERGREIHAEIMKQGYKGDPYIGNSLVDMYARCGALMEAHEVFAKLFRRDVVSWNTIIAGYVEHQLHKEALECFEQMQLEDISPTPITFVCNLKACGSIGAIDTGEELHAEVVMKGLENNPFIANTLVDLYVDCGSFAEAWQVFGELAVQDAGSWNTITKRYTEYGLGEAVLNCLEQMQLEGVSAGVITIVCSLNSCSRIGAIDKGRVLHAEIVREGNERDPLVANHLVDMYARCGSLAEAWIVFDELLPSWDVALWSIMIMGYVEHGESEKAFSVYAQMQEQGLAPLSTTFLTLLKACGNTSAIKTGQKFHALICGSCRLEPMEETMATTLIDMYGKCGSITDAQQVLDMMPKKDLVGWSALIRGYACQGESEPVFRLFKLMRGESVMPDGILFLSILTVCSHAGFVDKGQEYFEAMSKEYGITPTIEHHNCMIDLLGRAGQLNEAVAMLEKMPVQPDLVTWSSLLGACRKWGNVELGRQVFDHAVRLDVKYDVLFSLMCNIYADLHRWEEIEKIEAMRVDIQA